MLTHNGGFVVVSVAMVTTSTVDLVVEGFEEPEMLVVLEVSLDPDEVVVLEMLPNFEPLRVPLEVDWEPENVAVLETLINPEPLLAPLEDVTRLVNNVVGRKGPFLEVVLPVYVVLATVPVLVPVPLYPADLVLLAKKGGRVTFATVLMAVTVFVVTSWAAALAVIESPKQVHADKYADIEEHSAAYTGSIVETGLVVTRRSWRASGR